MAARDPAQQGAAIQRRAQAAQQNFAQQLRFELGVQERFGYFLETFEIIEEPTEEGGQEQRIKVYRERIIKMTQRGTDLLEVIARCACCCYFPLVRWVVPTRTVTCCDVTFAG